MHNLIVSICFTKISQNDKPSHSLLAHIHVFHHPFQQNTSTPDVDVEQSLSSCQTGISQAQYVCPMENRQLLHSCTWQSAAALLVEQTLDKHNKFQIIIMSTLPVDWHNFKSHPTQNRSFQSRSSQRTSWQMTEKVNLTNQKQTCICKTVTKLEIEPEQFLVLFRPGTTSVRSGLGPFFVREPEHAKHFLCS